MSDPFEYVNSINYTKKNLIENSDDKTQAEKSYSPWLVNTALSYFPDTVYYANMMNGNYHLDNKLQYSFLINIIRPKKRFSKWVKKKEDENLKAVCNAYGYNIKKAKVALQILSPEQVIKIIKLQGD
jgi:hypothetical protein